VYPRKEASKPSAFQNILSRRKILHNCYESHGDIPTLSPSPVAPRPFAFAGIWDSWKRPERYSTGDFCPRHHGAERACPSDS
jgi:hypothetical protein